MQAQLERAKFVALADLSKAREELSEVRDGGGIRGGLEVYSIPFSYLSMRQRTFSPFSFKKKYITPLCVLVGDIGSQFLELTQHRTGPLPLKRLCHGVRILSPPCLDLPCRRTHLAPFLLPPVRSYACSYLASLEGKPQGSVLPATSILVASRERSSEAES